MNSMEKKKYTRKQIAERIIDHGDLLVIYSDKIYRLNSWIKHHPGGEMVILHMVGKVRFKINIYIYIHKEINFQDATDEINAYHSDHILRHRLPSFYFGDIDKEDYEEFQSLIPPIQCDYQKNDLNNNRILTPEALLSNNNNQNMIKNASEHKHIIQKYRQLHYKLRFLGKKNFFFLFVLFF